MAMSSLTAQMTEHGYVMIFFLVLGEAMGLPVPAALALIAGGAAVASHALGAPQVFMVALVPLLLGDSLIYILGRYMGWALLGFLCKVSANPETCILRSAESFYKRGKKTLVMAKFIPGVNTMAPPLAGSMKMRYAQFLYLDLAGASLYILAYVTLGYVFRNFLSVILHGFHAAGWALELVMALAILAYIGNRIRLYRKHRVYRVVPRVQVAELARRLQSEQGAKILLVDVRSHGYYDAQADRIKGSIRIEPNNLSEEIKTLPRDRDIYVYCT